MYSWLNLRVLRLRKLAYLRFKISSYSAVLVIILDPRQQAVHKHKQSQGAHTRVMMRISSVALGSSLLLLGHY